MWISDPEGWLVNLECYERIGVQGTGIVAQEKGEAGAERSERTGLGLLHRHAVILAAAASSAEAQELLKGLRAALLAGKDYFDPQEYLRTLRAKGAEPHPAVPAAAPSSAPRPAAPAAGQGRALPQPPPTGALLRPPPARPR